jgi:hypothetical protein
MGNSCQCPTPPGGQVNCGPHQFAICRVRNGQVQSECVDQPKSFAILKDHARQVARNNWALQIITGIERDENQQLSGEDFQVLVAGQYRNEETDETVTFSLPWGMETVSSPTSNVLSRS